jgi:hypothetical protein
MTRHHQLLSSRSSKHGRNEPLLNDLPAQSLRIADYKEGSCNYRQRDEASFTKERAQDNYDYKVCGEP